MAQKHNISDTEYPMTRMGTIQQPSRRYRRLRHPSFTAAVWTANNPLLQRGEFGSEIDTGKLKVGDGVTYWNDLGYVAASQIDFADITGSPDDNVALKGALDGKVSKSGDSMSGDLTMEYQNKVAFDNSGATYKQYISADSSNDLIFGTTASSSVKFDMNMSAGVFSTTYSSGTLGNTSRKWANTFTAKINNGADIAVPTSGGTMARIEDINNKITNCITEIPQDIKFELNNGTLTLKSGSKVYIPNGSGTFDTVTTTADVSTTRTDSQKCMVWRYSSGNLGIFPIGLFFSGPTAPTQYTYMFWYDTTENKCKHTSDGGSTWTSGHSFPLCLVSTDGTKISAIDQVFNGFGCVGSTVFALSGVKGLIPDGRNADGTLKSVKFVNDSVKTRTIPDGDYQILFDGTEINYAYSSDDIYNEKENIIDYVGNGVIIGNCVVVNNKITSFNAKSVFHSLDYNDTDFIAHQAMPSNKYIDLTLPASGGTVTAPADGYIMIAKATGSANEYVSLTTNSNIQQNACCPITGFNIRLAIPVSKGEVVSINYSASGATQYFRFIYANGSK